MQKEQASWTPFLYSSYFIVFSFLLWGEITEPKRGLPLCNTVKLVGDVVCSDLEKKTIYIFEWGHGIVDSIVIENQSFAISFKRRKNKYYSITFYDSEIMLDFPILFDRDKSDFQIKIDKIRERWVFQIDSELHNSFLNYKRLISKYYGETLMSEDSIRICDNQDKMLNLLKKSFDVDQQVGIYLVYTFRYIFDEIIRESKCNNEEFVAFFNHGGDSVTHFFSSKKNSEFLIAFSFREGEKFFDFNGIDQNTHTVSTKDYYKGRFLLFDFWASWCGPCRKKNQTLKAEYEILKSKDNFEIISVSIDEDRKKWELALKEDNLPWPQILLEEDSQIQKKIKSFYRLAVIPVTALLDSEGQIIKINPTNDEIRDIVFLN